MKKKISILGCGWLGFDVAKHFVTKGFSVSGSTTSKDKIEKLKNEKVTPFLVDITQINSEEIHSFLNSEILIVLITSKNIEAFKILIEEVEKATIKNVVFISSTSVYPSLNKEITEEDETINSPLKHIEDLFLKNTNFKITVIRFAGLLGDERHPGNWFESRKIPNPDGFVNMIHKDDCIEIITQIIEKNIWNEVFNACVNHHPTRREFYTAARKSINKKLPNFEEDNSLKYKKINSNKLIKRLDYTFKYQNLIELFQQKEAFRE